MEVEVQTKPKVYKELIDSYSDQKELIEYIVEIIADCSEEGLITVFNDIANQIRILGFPFAFAINNSSFCDDIVMLIMGNEQVESSVKKLINEIFLLFGFTNNPGEYIPKIKGLAEILKYKPKIQLRKTLSPFEIKMVKMKLIEDNYSVYKLLLESGDLEQNFSELKSFILELQRFIDEDLSNYDINNYGSVNEFLNEKRNEYTEMLDTLLDKLEKELAKPISESNISDVNGKSKFIYNIFIIKFIIY